MNRIVKRSDKLTFFGVVGEDGVVTYHRMRGFSEISIRKNSKEYSRQYVDEEFEQSDVVGYSPSISFAFDQFKNDAVHSDLIALAESEEVGESAVRSILMVDLSQADDAGVCPAVMREFTVIFDSEASSMDAYSYSGNMKVKGEKIFGTATSEDAWSTCLFAEN